MTEPQINVNATTFIDALSNDLTNDLKADTILSYIQADKSSSSSFTYASFISSLSTQPAHNTFFSALLHHLQQLVQSGKYKDESSKDQHQVALQLLEATIQLCSLYISTHIQSSTQILPPAFIQCMSTLHEIILTIPLPVGAHVQSKLAQTLSAFYLTEHTQSLSILPLLISYLLLKSLEFDAKAADIKAVFRVHTALTYFDWTDTDNNTQLKTLLTRVIIHPLFLRNVEGRRFCASLFTLHSDLIQTLHTAVKAQLPYTRQSLLTHYGDVYWRAWRLLQAHPSASQLQLIFEQQCLQDLMSSALYSKADTTSAAVRSVLHVWHERKQQAGVDILLSKLYEPLLWRALSATNSILRRHAYAILIDVFPLISLDNTITQDEFIQKQLQLCLTAIQKDAIPTNRAIVIQGLCSILSVYWELIPTHMLTPIMETLLRMSHDRTSSVSRIAVCTGMKLLCNNHLAHTLLRTFLPLLSHCLHDHVSRVQLAFIDLLQTIKQLHTLKYYHITPLPQIFLALQHCNTSSNTAAVALGLSHLLLNSFMPLQKPVAIWLQRCVVFVRENPAAAQVFYSHLLKLIERKQCVTFMSALVQWMVYSSNSSSAEQENQGSNRLNTTQQQQQKKKQENKDKKDKKAKGKKQKPASSLIDQDEREDDESVQMESSSTGVRVFVFDEKLDVKDTLVIEHLSLILASVWQQVHTTSTSTSAAADHESDHGYAGFLSLFSATPSVFSTLFSSYAALTPLTHSTLMSLCSYLPPQASVGLSELVNISQLLSITLSTPTTAFAPIINGLFAWQQHDIVLQFIQHSLLQTTHTSTNKTKQQQKQKKQPELLCAPHVALRFLSYIFQQPHTRKRVFEACTTSDHKTITGPLDKILQSMQTNIPAFLQQLVQSTVDCDQKQQQMEYMLESISVFLRVQIHLHGMRKGVLESQEDEGEEADVGAVGVTVKGLPVLPEHYEQIMEFVTTQVLPILTLTVDQQQASQAAEDGEDETGSATKKSRIVLTVKDDSLTFPERLLLLMTRLTHDLLSCGYISHSSPAPHLERWLYHFHGMIQDTPSLQSSSPTLSVFVPMLYRICYQLSCLIMQDSAYDWEQEMLTDDSSVSCLVPNTLFASLWYALQCITPPSLFHDRTHIYSLVMETMKLFQSYGRERVLLSIMINTLFAIPQSITLPEQYLLVQLVSHLPAYLTVLPGIIQAICAANANGREADVEKKNTVQKVLVAMISDLLQLLDKQIQQAEKREIVFNTIQQCVMAMVVPPSSSSLASENISTAWNELKQQIEDKQQTLVKHAAATTQIPLAEVEIDG